MGKSTSLTVTLASSALKTTCEQKEKHVYSVASIEYGHDMNLKCNIITKYIY